MEKKVCLGGWILVATTVGFELAQLALFEATPINNRQAVLQNGPHCCRLASTMATRGGGVKEGWWDVWKFFDIHNENVHQDWMLPRLSPL